AAKNTKGLTALSKMGAQYYESLSNHTTLMLQLQALSASGDEEVRALVCARVAHMWDTVANTTNLDPVTVKSFLAFGMLLNTAVALDINDLEEPWAQGIRTRIQPGLFKHITTETNQ